MNFKPPNPAVAAVVARVCSGLFLMTRCLVANPLSEGELSDIRFDQALNHQLSLSLPFRDESGGEVFLNRYFNQKPVVLVFGYYQCPMLCNLVLNGLMESASDMKWSIGREFDVLEVSINPRETPALAAAKKKAYIKRYGRPGTEQGWHFLTGSETSIRQLTREAGFRYAYDSVSKEYAHPSGLIILTPEGRISGYQFGVTYPSSNLYASLRRASESQVSSPVQQFILLCFHYNPLTGKYSRLIMVCLRCCAAGTALGLLLWVIAMTRRARVDSGMFPSNLEPNSIPPLPNLSPAQAQAALPEAASAPAKTVGL